MADEDDSALLSDAMSDVAPEPKAEPAAEPEPVAEEQPPSRDRDPDTGRFKAKEAEPAKAPEAQVEPEPNPEPEAEPTPQQRHEGIPSWRLKEEADAKREALERASKYEAENREYQQRLKALEQQLQQYTQKKPDPIDPYENPEGWQRQQQDNLQRQLSNQRLVMAEEYARLHFGDEKVDQVLDWAEQSLSQQELNTILGGRNPIGNLMSRKQQADTLAEIGPDPKAYREKVLAEAMKDPEFVKSVLSQAKTEAASRPEQHVTKLPPSLNRQQSAASAKSDAGDPNQVPLSDAELLSDAMRR